MNYQVYAIKYATREARSNDNFYGHFDPHEDYPMPLDYFIWVVTSDQYTVVIDVGFTEEVAEQRKRTFHRCPVSVLPSLGIDPYSVSHVVITHMHYDHVGNLDKFPNAKFILQEAEMAFWTGKHASKSGFRLGVEVNDVLHLVKENFKGRIHFVNGVEVILPGITVYKAGGHSAGLQVVKVQTEKGNVILASDATHFYRNINENRPFIAVHNLAEMYDAFDLVRSLADDPNLIIPGHDPIVMERFPAAKPGLEGIVVRIT